LATETETSRGSVIWDGGTLFALFGGGVTSAMPSGTVVSRGVSCAQRSNRTPGRRIIQIPHPLPAPDPSALPTPPNPPIVTIIDLGAKYSHGVCPNGSGAAALCGGHGWCGGRHHPFPMERDPEARRRRGVSATVAAGSAVGGDRGGREGAFRDRPPPPPSGAPARPPLAAENVRPTAEKVQPHPKTAEILLVQNNNKWTHRKDLPTLPHSECRVADKPRYRSDRWPVDRGFSVKGPPRHGTRDPSESEPPSPRARPRCRGPPAPRHCHPSPYRGRRWRRGAGAPTLSPRGPAATPNNGGAGGEVGDRGGPPGTLPYAPPKPSSSQRVPWERGGTGTGTGTGEGRGPPKGRPPRNAAAW